jgi:hypothetical protein
MSTLLIAATTCGLSLINVLALKAAEPERSTASASIEDRVGFPKGYQASFAGLRSFSKDKEQKVVTIYGNGAAASITNAAQLPYPYGSVIVMETSSVLKDAQGSAVLDGQGQPRKDKVLGLHVMRRGRNFGEAYGPKRAGEWEFVEYQPDGGYLTPPQNSVTCAACHLKAGANRDFVFRGRLPPNEDSEGK